jgi:carbon-monoxide dehydrogenase iron sulfur subunit
VKRIYIKEEVCMACHLCEIYCQLQHSQSKDFFKAFKREPVRPLSRLFIEEKSPLSFSLRCQHCIEPLCVYACLTGALRRDSDSGIVTVDEEKCIGCWTCILACPFGVIRRNNAQKRMVKCDMCTDQDIPVCVAVCPNEALIYVGDGVKAGVS